MESSAQSTIRRLLLTLIIVLLAAGCPPVSRAPVTGSVGSRVGGGDQITSHSERGAYTAVATLSGVHYAATGHGLVRFDAKAAGPVRVKELADQRVLGLSAASSSGLWAATDKKLWRLFRGEWTSVPFPAILGGASSAMQATREGVWVGGTRGLGLLRKGKWSNYLPGARITYLMEDLQSGGVWVGTDGEGIYKYDKGKFIIHGPERGQSIRKVRCLSYTPEGGILAVGQSSQGERLNLFDGRFWISYRVKPEGVLHWVQVVEREIFIGHGHGVFRLGRIMPKVTRPGERRLDVPRGPVEFQGKPAGNVPYGYPVPIFYTEALKSWLPPRITSIAGYSRHLLLGTPGMGMAKFNGKEVTWLREGGLLGDNGRLRMACAGETCYLPGVDGEGYLYRDNRFGPIRVTRDKGARVQGFLNLADGNLISVHIPGDRQSLVVSVLRGELFEPLYESEFTYPSGRLEVRFLRQGPDGNIWAGLWYSDKVADRQPWGMVVLKRPDIKASTSPPRTMANAPASNAVKELTPAKNAVKELDLPDKAPQKATGEGDKAPQEAAAGAADKAPEAAEAQPAPTEKPAAPAEVPRIKAITFHRSTLLPDEDRPPGSLALPDDVRDVWFEKEYTWLATGTGVCRVKGQVVDLFTENEGLASELTYSVVRGFSGELLVATYSGVGRMMGTKWYFDFEGVLGKATRVLLPVEGGLWLGTTDGVIRMGGGKELHYNAGNGLASDDVTDLYLEERPGATDRIWVLTDLGLSIVRLR